MAVFGGCFVRNLLLVQLHALPFAVRVGLCRFAVSPFQASANQGWGIRIRHSPFVAFDVLGLSVAHEFNGHGLVAERRGQSNCRAWLQLLLGLHDGCRWVLWGRTHSRSSAETVCGDYRFATEPNQMIYNRGVTQNKEGSFSSSSTGAKLS